MRYILIALVLALTACSMPEIPESGVRDGD